MPSSPFFVAAVVVGLVGLVVAAFMVGYALGRAENARAGA